MPSAWFRPLVHNAVPPSLRGVREGPFPRFGTTMRHCDSLTPVSPHFVSFAWQYHRGVPCSSPSAQDLAVDQPGVGKPVLPPAITMEAAGSPKFLGTPRVPWPCSSTPAGSVTPGHCGVPTRSPRLTRARTPAMIFRGSIARPKHGLSVLENSRAVFLIFLRDAGGLFGQRDL